MQKNNNCKLFKHGLGLGFVVLSGFFIYKLQKKYLNQKSQQQLKEQKEQKEQEVKKESLYERMQKETEKKAKKAVDIAELEKHQKKPYELQDAAEEKQKKQEKDEELENLKIQKEIGNEEIHLYLQQLHQNLFQSYYSLTYFEGLLKNTLNVTFDLRSTVLSVVQGQLLLKILTKDIEFENSKIVKINQKRARNQLINVENFLSGSVEKSNQQHNLQSEQEQRNLYANILKKVNQFNKKNYTQESADDEKIRNIIKTIQDEFFSVISGKPATINYEIPENLNPENFLKITKEISLEACYKIQEVFRNNQGELIHLQGQIQIADTKVQQLIQSVNNEDIKLEVYEKYGLINEEDRKMGKTQLVEKFNQIMIKASQQFGEQDKDFKLQAKKLDQRFNFAYESCIYHPFNEKLVEQIFGNL